MNVRKINLVDVNNSRMLFSADGKEAIMINPSEAEHYLLQGWLADPYTPKTIEESIDKTKQALEMAEEKLAEISAAEVAAEANAKGPTKASGKKTSAMIQPAVIQPVDTQPTEVKDENEKIQNAS